MAVTRRLTPTNSNGYRMGPRPSALTAPGLAKGAVHHRYLWPTLAEKSDYRAWIVATYPSRGVPKPRRKS